LQKQIIILARYKIFTVILSTTKLNKIANSLQFHRLAASYKSGKKLWLPLWERDFTLKLITCVHVVKAVILRNGLH